MAEIVKRISADDRLKLLGLWTMATSHYAKAREFERAMRRDLGDEIFDQHIGDSIYASDGPHTVADFDDALLNSGVAVDGPQD